MSWPDYLKQFFNVIAVNANPNYYYASYLIN